MESIAEGPAKGKQRLLDRQLRLKKDPLHLAWWNMWWLRMERVAILEEKSKKDEKCRQVAVNSLKKFQCNTCM